MISYSLSVHSLKMVMTTSQKNEGKVASDVWVPGMTRNPETYILKDQVSKFFLVCLNVFFLKYANSMYDTMICAFLTYNFTNWCYVHAYFGTEGELFVYHYMCQIRGSLDADIILL